MVPKIRQILPAHRFLLLLNFMDQPRTTGAKWLADKRADDPDNYERVAYDAHIYHAFGDDQEPWSSEQDSCKTCCRDPVLLSPVADAGIPLVVGEYSLNTGFAGDPSFWSEYLQNQLSLWANTPHMIGSFFWNFRILRLKGGWYKELSLLELVGTSRSSIPNVAEMDLATICPGRNRSLCPTFDPESATWMTPCAWMGA